MLGKNFWVSLILDHRPQIARSPPITVPATAIMSQFRAAKLDIGCFAKIRNIRDHTKRKVFAENEPERYALMRRFNAFHD
jgi:hypothetical protein